jgi:hypothetical protein
VLPDELAKMHVEVNDPIPEQREKLHPAIV